MIFIWVIYSTNRILLSHTGIPGVILCFCTGSHAAAGRRFLFTRYILNNFLDFFNFLHDCWPWPIDCLIRFWSIFVVTLTFSFQGQIWNLLYLSQKWSNCHKTKSKHIDWTLCLKCDHQILPWAMTLTLKFQGQVWNLLYLNQKWSDCHKAKSKHIDLTPGLKYDQWVWPWPWPWHMNFQGQMWSWTFGDQGQV